MTSSIIINDVDREDSKIPMQESHPLAAQGTCMYTCTIGTASIKDFSSRVGL